MRKYLKSITTALICLVAVIILGFILPRLLPGNSIAYLTGMDEESLSPEKYEYYYNALHLGDSVLVQFLYYIKDLFNGTLGYSFKNEATVSSILLSRIPATLSITIPAMLLSSGVGLVWGMSSGKKRGKNFDKISSAFNVVVNAIPLFVICLIALIVFCFKNRIFPYAGLNSNGLSPGSLDYVFDRIYHLVLPVLCLFLAELPARFLAIRNATSSIMNEKYIFYAKARGLNNSTVTWKYIFTNIKDQFITLLFMSFGSSIGGALVVENLFSINGMGTLLSSAIHSLDYPLLQGILFVSCLMMVISILTGDILCIALSPKLRRGGNYEN